MDLINKILDQIAGPFVAYSHFFLRIATGVSFYLHGLDKFPLPPQGLIDYFNLSPSLASAVAIFECVAGVGIILGGFLNSNNEGSLSFKLGHLITRASAFTIVVIMIIAIYLVGWELKKLMQSEEIFLLAVALYFLVVGNFPNKSNNSQSRD